MSSYNYSYNVLINRFEAFAAGHLLIKRFTHGQIDLSDQLNDDQYPFMHVTPDTIEPTKGAMQFGFHIMFADIPRDKETKAEYQREVISDCVRLGQDLIAEITNGLQLFGFNVQMIGDVVFEPFMEEQKNTVTGVAFTIKLEVPWDWSACDIPAVWAVGGESTGGSGSPIGLLLQVNNVNNVVQSELDLVAGTNITLTDNGDGSVTIDSTGGGGGGGGTVTSVGLTAPAAFNVSGSPVTTSGTLALTAAGNASQYITGAGALQTFPTIPAAQVNSDWNAVSGVAQILNKPTIPTTLDSLTDVNAPTPSNGQVLSYNGTEWVNTTPSTGGTVTSVGLTMPSAFSVTGSPVTTSGTLAVAALGNSTQYIDGTGALQSFPALTGFVPYVGATQDVDLDTNKLSARSIYIEGTGGNGHLHLKHQSADATATGQSTSLWADTNGDIKWKNDGDYKTTLKTSLNTTDRVYTFPDEDCTLMPKNAPITGATKTKITYDADGLVTAGADIVASDISDSTTVGQNLITLPNPSAVRYLRINADNTVSALSLASLKSDLGFNTAVLATDITNATSTGYEDVTGLSFAVTSGKTYKWRATLGYTNSANIQISINGPTVTFNRYRFTSAGTSTGNIVSNQTTYNNPNSTSAAVSGVSTADGIIKPSANGTVIVRYRCASIGGLTILAGSIIEWEEVL